jgi:hypothetical protein
VVNINLLGRSIGVKIHAEDIYSAWRYLTDQITQWKVLQITAFSVT